MVDGPNAAAGPGSAEKTPGATNLDGASNNEQASVTGAVVRAMGSPAPADPQGPSAAAAPGPADAKAQDTALNGAQVTAALEIVAKVAAREPIGAITGMKPAPASVRITEGSIDWIAPTWPMSISSPGRSRLVTISLRARISPPSWPVRPTARPPSWLISSTISLLTWPARTWSL